MMMMMMMMMMMAMAIVMTAIDEDDPDDDGDDLCICFRLGKGPTRRIMVGPFRLVVHCRDAVIEKGHHSPSSKTVNQYH